MRSDGLAAIPPVKAPQVLHKGHVMHPVMYPGDRSGSLVSHPLNSRVGSQTKLSSIYRLAEGTAGAEHLHCKREEQLASTLHVQTCKPVRVKSSTMASRARIHE